MTQNTVFQWVKNNFLLSHKKLIFFTILNLVINVETLVGVFDQEEALDVAFSLILKTDASFAALVTTHCTASLNTPMVPSPWSV